MSFADGVGPAKPDVVANAKQMTNVECRRNDETGTAKSEPLIAHSSLEHSGLFRHSSFVLRHSLAFVY